MPRMISFPVSESKKLALATQMARLGIFEQDLEEEFIRGSGPGGQKVNKTSVVVQLRHRPTGMQVSCQQSRSQGLNRYYARKLLSEKIEEKISGEHSAKQQAIQKIRRQKRRRSRRAKEKMLVEKKKVSEKKSLRKKPVPD